MMTSPQATAQGPRKPQSSDLRHNDGAQATAVVSSNFILSFKVQGSFDQPHEHRLSQAVTSSTVYCWSTHTVMP